MRAGWKVFAVRMRGALSTSAGAIRPQLNSFPYPLRENLKPKYQRQNRRLRHLGSAGHAWVDARLTLGRWVDWGEVEMKRGITQAQSG